MTEARAAHVLLAEDEPMIGRILEHKLLREGHRVTWARTAVDAEAALRCGDVDVALIDATLERDGIDMAAQLQGAHVSASRGWLAMVAARDAAGPARARDAGAAGVVVKPFKPTAVAAQVATLLAALAT